jgi:hypothetical protein
VAGQLLESGAAGADLLLLAVSPALGGALEDVGASLSSLLRPHHVLGVCTASIVGGGRCLGETGVAALAVSGTACRAAELDASAPPPGTTSPPDAPTLVVAPLGSPVPPPGPRLVGGTPMLTPGARSTPPGAIWLDGRAADTGAEVWYEPGSGVQVVDLGGWRSMGPPRIAGGSPHRLATLDGVTAAEVVVAELAGLDPQMRADVTDVALRPHGSWPAPLVGLGAGGPGDAVRTSTAIADGAAVELVVRHGSAVAAELVAVMEQHGTGGAVVCSPLVRPGASGARPGRGGLALGPALAGATAGLAVIGLALGAATVPAPVLMMLW